MLGARTRRRFPGYVSEEGRGYVVGVDARTVGDMQTAVTFAVQQNLKLVVGNTGYVVPLYELSMK